MASAPRRIKVFLASPGDVVDEREAALRVLELLEYDPLLPQKISIQHVAWDKRGAGAPILAGINPQDSIANGLPRPRECDIVVTIFWSRMGTPLPASYAKPDGSRYESGTEWEYEDAVAGFHEKGLPFVLLYRRAEKVLLDPAGTDFDERVEQYRRVERFFEKFRNSDGSFNSGFTPYTTPDDFRKQLEIDLKFLVARILERAPSPEDEAAAVAEPWHGSPFPGLRPFTSDDTPIFFGRDREIDMVASRAKTHPFVGVVGASGSGKSSLVAAGVIPRLRLSASAAGEAPWLTVQFTPDQLGSGDPFASAASALLHTLPSAARPQLANTLANDPQLLAHLLGEHAGEQRVLVFVDQFEEVFTTVRPALRDTFVTMLAELTGDARLQTIITIRGDFYGRCVEQQTLARLLESSTVPLSAPGVAALYEMIVRPATRARLTFEDGLLQRILDDTGQEPGALALMAYTLDELYRRSSQQSLLTHAAYEELGGVQGAIGKRSETIFASLGEDERNALPRVFRELVEVDEEGIATRQRARLARVADTPAAARLTDALTGARLLVQSRGDDNQPVVEVAHEALFRSWSRLADWIKDTENDLRLLRQVRNAAADWNANGRRDDFLWSYERLAPVYAMRDRLHIVLDPVVGDFVRPEYDRIVERMRMETREFRQRSYVERLIEIGPAAAGALVQSLQHGRAAATRKDIAAALENMGAAAVLPLLEAAVSSAFPRREEAIAVLTAIHRPLAGPLPTRLLEDRDGRIRATAIHLITAGGSQKMVPALVQLFHDPQPNVRALAVMAVASFDDDRAFDALAAAIDGDPALRAVVLDVLHHLLRKDRTTRLVKLAGPAGKQLIPLLEKNAASVRVAGRAAVLVDALTPVVGADDLPASDLAVRILLGIGTTNALYAVLNNMNATRVPHVIRIILDSLDVRIASALLLLLEHSSPSIRNHAGLLIKRIVATPKLSNRVMNILRNSDVRASLFRWADSAASEFQSVALASLSMLKDQTAQPFFRAGLTSADPEIRRVSIAGLARTGDTSAIPGLIAALRDEDKGVRLAAAGALNELKAGTDAAAAALSVLESIAGANKQSAFKSALIDLVSAAPSREAKNVLERVRTSGTRAAKDKATLILREKAFANL